MNCFDFNGLGFFAMLIMLLILYTEVSEVFRSFVNKNAQRDRGQWYLNNALCPCYCCSEAIAKP